MDATEVHRIINASIGSGNKVIILDRDGLEILQLMLKELHAKNISNVEIWQSFEEKTNSGVLKYVSKEVIDKVKNIYKMYEFSDKVSVISNSDQYGNLFNYVKTGLLTKQEMVDALLYKI